MSVYWKEYTFPTLFELCHSSKGFVACGTLYYGFALHSGGENEFIFFIHDVYVLCYIFRQHSNLNYTDSARNALVHADIPYRNFFLFLNFIPALIGI
jgi:hypothetical protein